jgi:hypothetical protein
VLGVRDVGEIGGLNPSGLSPCLASTSRTVVAYCTRTRRPMTFLVGMVMPQDAGGL